MDADSQSASGTPTTSPCGWLTVGYRVLVCDNMAFHGDFTPVLAKLTKTSEPLNPGVEEFGPRTAWSLSNALTSTFKELDPIPQFPATAKLKWLLELATDRSTN